MYQNENIQKKLNKFSQDFVDIFVTLNDKK